MSRRNLPIHNLCVDNADLSRPRALGHTSIDARLQLPYGSREAPRTGVHQL